MTECGPSILNSNQRPLCVDLDGTLVHTDMLYESLFAVLKVKPWLCLAILLALLRGRAHLKQFLAQHYAFDPAVLPYRTELLDFIRQERAKGRPIYLSTASDVTIAEKIAKYLGLFTAVFGSDGILNNKGQNKATDLVQRFGSTGFDYAGDSGADRAVWAQATGAILVGAAARADSNTTGKTEILARFPDAKISLPLTVLKAIRVHQWVKNLLLFLPVILAHRLSEPLLFAQVLVAFFSFCCCASSVYVLNDLFDLEADRHHQRKRNRPFASGVLPLTFGFTAVPALLGVSAILASMLPTSYALVLIGYYLVTLAYSFRLKQVVLVDILTLAALYTVRMIAGGAAANVDVSQWLLAFSMFFFLSLACVKRYSELFSMRQNNIQEAKGRGYVAADLELIGQFGSAAGYLSVLVLALYLNSKDVAALYAHAELLWLMCPLLLYWISRVWLIAHRGRLHDDPIVFAIRDRTSYVVGMLVAVILVLAVR